MGGCGPERCIATTRNEKMVEKSEKQGRVEAHFEGGQGPEGAVAPYMDGWIFCRHFASFMMADLSPRDGNNSSDIGICSRPVEIQWGIANRKLLHCKFGVPTCFIDENDTYGVLLYSK
jgi:hypothetical protein